MNQLVEEIGYVLPLKAYTEEFMKYFLPKSSLVYMNIFIYIKCISANFLSVDQLNPIEEK